MMNRRVNILARLRRGRAGAGRFIVAWFAVAYLAANTAPCAVAASGGPEHAVPAHERSAHAHHAAREQGTAATLDGHGAHLDAPPSDRGAREHCPHCPLGDDGAARMHDAHASCLALEDLRSAAAPQAKAAPPALAPAIGPAAFTLPPPLASPFAAPPLRAVAAPRVPLNVRHCVFLI